MREAEFEGNGLKIASTGDKSNLTPPPCLPRVMSLDEFVFRFAALFPGFKAPRSRIGSFRPVNEVREGVSWRGGQMKGF